MALISSSWVQLLTWKLRQTSRCPSFPKSILPSGGFSSYFLRLIHHTLYLCLLVAIAVMFRLLLMHMWCNRCGLKWVWMGMNSNSPSQILPLFTSSEQEGFPDISNAWDHISTCSGRWGLRCLWASLPVQLGLWFWSFPFGFRVWSSWCQYWVASAAFGGQHYLFVFGMCMHESMHMCMFACISDILYAGGKWIVSIRKGLTKCKITEKLGWWDQVLQMKQSMWSKTVVEKLSLSWARTSWKNKNCMYEKCWVFYLKSIAALLIKMLLPWTQVEGWEYIIP